jgi:hypothetical protein
MGIKELFDLLSGEEGDPLDSILDRLIQATREP